MKCNIIGAGRLGKNTIMALAQANMINVQAVCNNNLESATRSCEVMGFGYPVNTIDQLPPAELICITCGDDSIQSVVQSLLKHTPFHPDCLVFHCSGVLSSAVLSPLKKKGCSVASIHPLKAFRTGYLDAHAFNDVDCVAEGDEHALSWLTSSFTGLGARIITINPEKKASYHAAACMASNYLITIAACSEDLLLNTGLTQEQSRSMVCKLMQGNLTNLMQVNHVNDALTGPLMRGDINTLSLHLQAIVNPEVKALYKIAGLATLALTQLTEEKKQAVISLLSQYDK